MLQQTQVDRVVPKYKSFLKKFSSLSALAKAPLSVVLIEWQGLGYNRRAKMIHDAAKEIMTQHNGIFPRTHESILSLPGVGPYTASAVRVFAYNEPEVLIETNVRSVFIHHFFPRTAKVSDSALLPLIKKTLPQAGKSREWYSALMDYGSHLKQTVGNASKRSAHHIRQKPFKGSDRELRGAILRALSKQSQNMQGLLELGFSKRRITTQIKALLKEGLIFKNASSSFSLPL